MEPPGLGSSVSGAHVQASRRQPFLRRHDSRNGLPPLDVPSLLSWSSMPLPRVKCEVSGLLLIYSVNKDSDRVPDNTSHRPLIGMIVDTTLIPYSFMVILVDEVIGTRIYDSKSRAWTQKPSTYRLATRADRRASCVSHNEFFYVYVKILRRNQTTFDFHAYDLQKD